LPILAASLVFSLLFLYFAFFKNDPWTKEMGHTWSLYKLVQWFYCVIFFLQVLTIDFWSRKVKRSGYWIPVSVLVLIGFFYIPRQFINAKEINQKYSAIFNSPYPIRDLTRLKSELNKIDPQNQKTLVIVTNNKDKWPKIIYTYFLRDYKISSDWEGVGYIPRIVWHPQIDRDQDSTICLTVDRQRLKSEEQVIQELPANGAVIDCRFAYED